MTSKNKPNYTLKDSLFIDLFSDKMRLIQLYKSLIDDDREINQDDIEILTIQNIILRGIYNDLGFRVKDEIIILMENKNLNELYNTKPRIIPKIKLFVVYTGDKMMQDHDLYLKDVMVEKDIISDIDMKVRVLCTGNKKSILGQYILFTRVYTKQKKECKDIETAVKNTIEICMNDEISFESFLKDEVKRGRKEGREEGREEGKMDTLINFFKNGAGLDLISKAVGMSTDEVKSILIGRGFEV